MTIPIRAAAEPALGEDAPAEGGSGLTAIDLFCGIAGRSILRYTGAANPNLGGKELWRDA